MRRLVNFATVIAFCVLGEIAYAQDAPNARKTSGADIFGAFSYGNYELISLNSSSSISSTVTTSGFSTLLTSPLTLQPQSARLGLFGWNGTVTTNLNAWFGITTDVGGMYSNGSGSVTQAVNCSTSSTVTCSENIQLMVAHPKIHNFMFGPQFTYPSRKVRPFARFMVGGSRRSLDSIEYLTVTETGAFTTNTSSTSVTSSSTNLFTMAFGGGGDYMIRRKLGWRTTVDYLTGQGTAQNHVRVSTGIVWHVGG